MDAISYSYADKQAKRIKKFINEPDLVSGVVTVPKVIASGESVTIPVGRVAVLPNVQVEGELNIEGEVFIPSGSTIDFTNGITVDGNRLVMSVPTSYHIYNGSVEATNTVVTNGFSTTLYTGNGTTQSVVTGIDMSTQWGNDVSETFGGLVWIKNRNNTGSNTLQDTIRGVVNAKISTNTTDAQGGTNVSDATYGRIRSFSNTRFTVENGAQNNQNTYTYSSWNFQTTHRKTGVTNHGKAYTEHYNPFTGFTIIKYDGSGLVGHEIPHSLGRKLGFFVSKSITSITDWDADTEFYNMRFNTNIAGVNPNKTFYTNNVSLNASSNSNASGQTHIMYGWANSYYDVDNTLIGNYEIGQYQGTGVVGNKITTRGKPAWVMIKRLDVADNWLVLDNQRNTSNPYQLSPNTSAIEATSIPFISFETNSFTLQNTTADKNASGGQYLYMVVYDNDSGSGKSKYPKATDTTNLTINALVPYANGIDVNGEKVSISHKNETITGLSLIQGKNYPYSKNDGTYGINKYLPMYGKLRDRIVAGENSDYFDLETRKWYGTSGGAELVTNGTFDTNTTGWTASAGATLTVDMGNLKVAQTTNDGVFAYQTLTCIVGKTYKLISSVNYESVASAGQVSIGTTIGGFDIALNIGLGTKVTTFIAQSTTLYLTLKNSTTTDNTFTLFDNISVFEAVPIIGAEITPRTYLDCVVYADHNGQVEYVEELPKIEYVNKLNVSNLKVTDGFDLGQTWQNVTASRTRGVTYTNTTGKSIQINITLYPTASTTRINITVNSVIVSEQLANSSFQNNISLNATVPSGATYSYNVTTGTATGDYITELR